MPALELPALGTPLLEAFPLPQTAIQGVFPKLQFPGICRLHVRPSVCASKRRREQERLRSLHVLLSQGGPFWSGGRSDHDLWLRSKINRRIFCSSAAGRGFAGMASRGIEIWAHGLIGDAYFGPTSGSGLIRTPLGFEARRRGRYQRPPSAFCLPGRSGHGRHSLLQRYSI